MCDVLMKVLDAKESISLCMPDPVVTGVSLLTECSDENEPGSHTLAILRSSCAVGATVSSQLRGG